MNSYIIKFILLFKPVFKRFDVDTNQLAVILSVKLMMDDRRPNAFMMGKQQQKKSHNRSSLLALGFLFLMGCFLLILLVSENAILGHTLYFTVFMVMISLILISDFTTVLIDVRDNYIIIPRPVKDSTAAISRILHIAIHISKIVLAFCLPAFIGLLIIERSILAALLFFIECTLATMFTIFLVNMVYLVLLKVSSPQKFKDFISYFQIIFSILIFAAYQLLPRLLTNPAILKFDVLSNKILYILPPVWLASLYQLALHPSGFSWLKFALAFTAVAFPVVALYIVVKVLAPGFNRKLSAIAGSGSVEVKPAAISKKANSRQKPGFAEKLSVLLTTDKAARAGFRLTWWLSSRYRDFKIKVYPSFAFVLVYFVYFLFMPGRRNGGRSFENLQTGSAYILLTYITSFVILTVLHQVSQAEKYKAAWIMFSTPHNKPGKLLAGMFKALILKYFVPYYLLICLFCLYTWGPVVINDLVLSFFNVLIFGLITALFTVKHLPFSQPVIGNKQGGRVIVNLLITSFIGVLGFIHYGLSRWEWVISALALLSGGCCWLIFYYFQKRDWQAIAADYD